MDFVRRWSEKTEIGAGRFIVWLDITASKFYDWRERYGKVNEHNGWVPRDFWLENWEKQAIIGFHLKNPLEGYRRLTFMMLDADIVAVSPTSVWRVLGQAGLLSKWNGKPSKKGTGFEQPLAVHQHWHIDVSYINISGTFYYLCSILDGCSRYIVNWDLRESMTEADIEVILERAKELHPEAKPRIISDNGSQFIAKDFKEFIRISGMTHVRTSPYYPQSNGKIERWHKSLKGECIRPGRPLSLDDARRLFGFRSSRNLGPSVTEERADVVLQGLFHFLFGFFEIAPWNRDSQLDASTLPAIIFGPECAFYRHRSYYRYGHRVVSEMCVEAQTASACFSMMPALSLAHGIESNRARRSKKADFRSRLDPFHYHASRKPHRQMPRIPPCGARPH